MSDNGDGDDVLGWGIVLAFSGTFFILLFQVFGWAKTGQWMPLSIVSVFQSNPDSLYNPTDWIGLAKIARTLLELPLSLVWFLLVSLGGLLLGKLDDAFPMKPLDSE